MTGIDTHQILQRGVVVSCHADDGMNDDAIFVYFVQAAIAGGAVALRLEGVDRVRKIRTMTNLPIIGFTEGRYPDGSMLVTPEADDIEKLIDAGADIVAIDATKRKRPDGTDGFIFFEKVKKPGNALLWADIANFREGIRAAEIGADFVATTLSGHTPGTMTHDYRVPDYELIRDLSHSLTIPVIAEGRIWTPEAAVLAMSEGAFAVVVGSAITRPRIITTTFYEALKEHFGKAY